MKKFPLAFILLWLLSATAFAQTSERYRFDNFDVKDGVRVASVETSSSLVPESKSRLTAKTSKVSAVNARTSTLGYTRARVPAAMSASKSLDGFTTGDPRIDAFIVESGVRNGVDPVLIYALMHQESSFKRGAISVKGARGLMQLMPGTAARFGVNNIFDPRQNIEGGTRYLRFLLDAFDGDIALTLAGYNAGEGAVLKYGRRVPPYRETQEYVRRITQRYSLMRDPETARNARAATPTEVASAQAQTAAPLNNYERNVFAVRLPDGRLQLITQ
ncbi:MAG TPA: lytic transglycosylase domain-containing protein [Pyrinomonadaceae bacterium]|jgi:soluble lytic murein transglycosylase-like protein